MTSEVKETLTYCPVGTRGWISPEVLEGSKLLPASDNFCLVTYVLPEDPDDYVLKN